MRGELAELLGLACVRVRFIPACAGNSRWLADMRREFRVHPRLRGELKESIASRWPKVGSSPLARGTLAAPLFGADLGRFIPACAGNSLQASLKIRFMSVHPRLRGELKFDTLPKLNQDGSSPLARGTPYPPNAPAFDRRFIPACAGNSRIIEKSNRLLSVHPRLRGELSIQLCEPTMRVGSSPLARGTHPRKACSLPLTRFIPACAGNSK